MFISLPDTVALLEKYKYLIIFPIAIFEGPIVIIISGFLTYLGFLNMLIIIPLLVVGDLIGDSLYYAVGRYGSKFAWMKQIGHFFGFRARNQELLKKHFEKHTIKTLLIGKLAHGVGAVVQVTAGIAQVNFGKYFVIEMFGTIVKTLALFFIGFYIGGSYVKIDQYLDAMAYIILALVLFVLLYLVARKYSTKTLDPVEKKF